MANLFPVPSRLSSQAPIRIPPKMPRTSAMPKVLAYAACIMDFFDSLSPSLMETSRAIPYRRPEVNRNRPAETASGQ